MLSMKDDLIKDFEIPTYICIILRQRHSLRERSHKSEPITVYGSVLSLKLEIIAAAELGCHLFSLYGHGKHANGI